MTEHASPCRMMEVRQQSSTPPAVRSSQSRLLHSPHSSKQHTCPQTGWSGDSIPGMPPALGHTEHRAMEGRATMIEESVNPCCDLWTMPPENRVYIFRQDFRLSPIHCSACRIRVPLDYTAFGINGYIPERYLCEPIRGVFVDAYHILQIAEPAMARVHQSIDRDLALKPCKGS